MTEKKNCSFAGGLANQSIDSAKPLLAKETVEDPAVIGGSLSTIPIGSVVDLTNDKGFSVVEKSGNN